MAEIKKNIGEIEIPPLIVEDIKREVKIFLILQKK